MNKNDESEAKESQARQMIALGARMERTSTGWSVRIPVSAERISVAKRVVVREELLVRPEAREETTSVTETVAREQLRAEGLTERTERVRPIDE